MTPIEALSILAQAQAVAPLIEADRNKVYEAIKTLRPLVEEVSSDKIKPEIMPEK